MIEVKSRVYLLYLLGIINVIYLKFSKQVGHSIHVSLFKDYANVTLVDGIKIYYCFTTWGGGGERGEFEIFLTRRGAPRVARLCTVSTPLDTYYFQTGGPRCTRVII